MSARQGNGLPTFRLDPAGSDAAPCSCQPNSSRAAAGLRGYCKGGKQIWTHYRALKIRPLYQPTVYTVLRQSPSKAGRARSDQSNRFADPRPEPLQSLYRSIRGAEGRPIRWPTATPRLLYQTAFLTHDSLSDTPQKVCQRLGNSAPCFPLTRQHAADRHACSRRPMSRAVSPVSATWGTTQLSTRPTSTRRARARD